MDSSLKNPERRFFRPDTQSLDVWAAVNEQTPFNTAADQRNAHTLMLTDQS